MRLGYEKAIVISCLLQNYRHMAFYDDGIYDNLTGALAPVYFYESAERLLSWAERSHQPVSLIALRLAPLDDDSLIRCSREISRELRGGDLFSRMSDYTFALLLLGDKLGAEQLIFRLRNTTSFPIDYQSTQVEVGEGVEAGLTRLAI